MATQRVGDLEVGQDLDFQRRMWIVQRVGWTVMGFIVLAGLVGFLGSGPLSQATARTDGVPIQVQYKRLARFKAPITLQIELEPGAAPDGHARVWIDSSYLHGFQIQHVTPEPQSVEAGPDRVIYVFQVADPSQPTTITFDLESQQLWRAAGRIGLGDSPPARFTQFIWP